MLACLALAFDPAPASAQTPGVKGPVPTGLPQRMLVGLFEEAGQTWMRDSGVPWDVRYRYFTKGWVDNWGWGQRDGSWGKAFLQESDAQGFLPAPIFYQLFAEPGGGEGETLAKVQNAATMRGYFGDWKLLLQRAKEHGKPVLLLVEPDAVGLLQHQTNSNPQTYAAIADTGLPELAGLPNTVAGWGLAFLQLRKAVGANNVILGLHVSSWASGKDISCCSLTDPLQPEVDKVVRFLEPLGLKTNVTGATYDVLVGDPLDRDADFYKLTRGQDVWWNASDSAAIASRSFNRYAEWLRLMNQTAGKRWVLWQIPLGNTQHRNINNDGTPRAGYRDNRTEYFFGPNGDAHRRKFANAGVIALLFGAGAGGQSTYVNDLGTDGQPYLESHAAPFLDAGGLTLPAPGTTLPLPGGDAGTPTPPDAGTGDAGTGDGGTGGGRGHGFETSLEGWTSAGASLQSATLSTARAWSGTRSLAVPFTGTAGNGVVSVLGAAVPSGAVITFHVWIPTGSAITAIQPFALEGAASNWRYTGRWTSIGQLQTGAWNTLTVALPANSNAPLYQLGVELTTSGGWTGSLHLDDITW
ncbi:hypothetical protein LY474_25900 [Myxococcus stipitatus]|uniref:hypothetical protein n=1 Tax=Myxococcus stipitatus TaxID=83455 RepID=UPI001F1591C6|nr:hypothetical protein [Myxococcus stipitatus]MCE9671247.1 hypothetical protein [Myxococcus stipitatus]